MDRDIDLEIGSLGRISFKAGEYCYAGSAMNGIENRISRHMRRNKTIRWHIDRLTVVAEKMEAHVSDGEEPVPECIIAETASDLGAIRCVKGFGSSDCRCPTHLFRIDPEEKEKLITLLDLNPFSDI